ncbi:hypothetical protein MKX03_029489 [Papaver bracteatum]|nr:hypothetical protein MKX03_029489 [Papaver bracteatum]
MSTLVPVDHDIESTDTEIIEQNITGTTTSTPTDQGNSNSTRNHWRQILLLFRVCLHLKYSIINNGATNISATDPAYAELPSYEALFDHDGINSEDNGDTNITTTDNNNNNSTTPELTVPFATSSINKDTLIRILKEMNLITLRDHGGVEGLAASLATDLENGISTEVEVLQRRQVEYGTNTYCPESIDPPKNFVHFLLRACKDWTIILLLCCAAISLASGLKEEGQENGWYDGTTLFIIVFVLVSATSFRNYISSCRSQELKINKNLLVINVLRQGLLQEVVVCDIVVGDLVFLSAGDWIPSDGLFVNGNDLKVEDGVWHHELTIIDDQNPFLYYGAKVIYGSGHMLVTSVGMNTTMGNMMSKVIHDVNRKGSPLQFQIDKINTYLQNVGLFLGVLILLVLLVRYFRGEIRHKAKRNLC